MCASGFSPKISVSTFSEFDGDVAMTSSIPTSRFYLTNSTDFWEHYWSVVWELFVNSYDISRSYNDIQGCIKELYLVMDNLVIGADNLADINISFKAERLFTILVINDVIFQRLINEMFDASEVRLHDVSDEVIRGGVKHGSSMEICLQMLTSSIQHGGNLARSIAENQTENIAKYGLDRCMRRCQRLEQELLSVMKLFPWPSNNLNRAYRGLFDPQLTGLDASLFASVSSATIDEAKTIEDIRARLEAVVLQKYDQAKITVFGSSLTGLASPGSDVDMSVAVRYLDKGAIAARKKRSALSEEIRRNSVGLEFLEYREAALKAFHACVSDIHVALSSKIRKLDLEVESMTMQAQLAEAAGERHLSLAISELNQLRSEGPFADGVSRREKLQNQLAEVISSENQIKRSNVFRLGSVIRAVSTYQQVELVPKARVGVIHFIDIISYNSPRRCDLIVNNQISACNSRLIKAYLDADVTGKVRAFILLVKMFAKSNKMSSGSGGHLSSYAWTVLCLHHLLRLDLVPNLQETYKDANIRRVFCEDVDVTFYPMESFPEDYLDLLETVLLDSLLLQFFRYFLTDFDMLRDVATLRGRGQTRDKQQLWGKDAVPWRISIEDPFERADSVHPRDLGSTLTRTGLLQFLAGMKRGYALLTSLGSAITDADAFVRTFLSAPTDPEEVIQEEPAGSVRPYDTTYAD